MMRLPIINNDIAEKIWNARKNSEDLPSIDLEYIGQDEDKLTCFELDDLVEQLNVVKDSYNGKNMIKVGGQIDSDLTEIVHSKLSTHGSVHELCQLGFWRWLSNVAHNGFFWEFIMWRFDSDKKINWGITNSPSSIIEIYFYRAWFRGHKMYDPESTSDPYKYAKLGSSDVWRSHILRQDFGRDKEFVKAFLDTIYDKSGKTTIDTENLRKRLIPAIRAWTSGSTFSHLSYKENLELIKKLYTEGV